MDHLTFLHPLAHPHAHVIPHAYDCPYLHILLDDVHSNPHKPRDFQPRTNGIHKDPLLPNLCRNGTPLEPWAMVGYVYVQRSPCLVHLRSLFPGHPWSWDVTTGLGRHTLSVAHRSSATRVKLLTLSMLRKKHRNRLLHVVSNGLQHNSLTSQFQICRCHRSDFCHQSLPNSIIFVRPNLSARFIFNQILQALESLFTVDSWAYRGIPITVPTLLLHQ